MQTFGKDENMTSRIDDACAKILLALSRNTADAVDFAQLQRAMGAGSVRTVKRHVEHLQGMGLVQVRTEKRGMRDYYRISLNSKGNDTVRRLQQKGN